MGTRLDLLRICLQSLVAQTQPCRIFVVTMDPERVRAVSDDLGGTLTVLQEEGRGLSAAINQAWDADGWQSEFTGWLGDDDALPPWSVEVAAAALRKRPGAVMVHGRCLFIDQQGRPRWVARNGALGAMLAGYGVNLIAQPGSLFRTQYVRQVGGLDERLRYAMDVDLYARLRRLGPVISSRAQLGVFREHDAGLSTANQKAAALEARRQQRRQQDTVARRAFDLVAGPTTRLVGRVTRRLPPSANRFWAPHT